MKREIKYKILLGTFVLSVLVIFILLSSYTTPKIYKSDYAELYSEQLSKLFDSHYTIGKRKTISGIRNPEGKKYYYRYYEWDIEYNDKYGYTYCFPLNNAYYSFENQVFEQYKNQVAEYYKRVYLDNFLDRAENGELNIDSLSCNFRAVSSSAVESNYNEKLENVLSDTLLDIKSSCADFSLYSIDYEDVFSYYPMYLYIKIYVDENCDKSDVETMIDGVNSLINLISRETNETCNMVVMLRDKGIETEYTNSINNVLYEWYILDGEVTSFVEHHNFQIYSDYQKELYNRHQRAKQS